MVAVRVVAVPFVFVSFILQPPSLRHSPGGPSVLPGPSSPPPGLPDVAYSLAATRVASIHAVHCHPAWEHQLQVAISTETESGNCFLVTPDVVRACVWLPRLGACGGRAISTDSSAHGGRCLQGALSLPHSWPGVPVSSSLSRPLRGLLEATAFIRTSFFLRPAHVPLVPVFCSHPQPTPAASASSS